MVASCLALGLAVRAESAKPADKKPSKTPAALELEQFAALAAAAKAKPSDAAFQKTIDAGMAWLNRYADDSHAPQFVQDFGGFSMTLKPDQKAQRASYTGRIHYEIVNQKYKPDITPETKTALAALDAAVSDAEARNEFNRANLQAVREKIDALAAQPKASAFLVNAEHTYFDLLTRGISPAAGEKHLRSLLDHSDTAVVSMAQDELNLVAVRKEPFAYKFTALDGAVIDCAQHRGKVLAVLFWSSKGENSRKEIEALRDVYSEYHRDGFEVVTVAFDSAADKDGLTAAVKDLKLAWPVAFDGNAEENAIGKKLNVRKAPAIALFDQKGILVATGLRANRVGPAVKQLLGIQDAPPEPRSSGSKRRR